VPYSTHSYATECRKFTGTHQSYLRLQRVGPYPERKSLNVTKAGGIWAAIFISCTMAGWSGHWSCKLACWVWVTPLGHIFRCSDPAPDVFLGSAFRKYLHLEVAGLKLLDWLNFRSLSARAVFEPKRLPKCSESILEVLLKCCKLHPTGVETLLFYSGIEELIYSLYCRTSLTGTAC